MNNSHFKANKKCKLRSIHLYERNVLWNKVEKSKQSSMGVRHSQYNFQNKKQNQNFSFTLKQSCFTIHQKMMAISFFQTMKII